MALTERDINLLFTPSTHAPPVQKTPQRHSKLPRLVAMPASVSPTPQWSSSVAERVARAERAVGDTRSPSEVKQLALASRKQPQGSVSPALDKPLPHDKPLPSRPIARLSSMLSPSKDSRSLIDAIEQPLRITTPLGEMRDWPSLTPQSSPSMNATPEFGPSESQARAESSSRSRRGTPSSLVAAAAELTNVITLQTPVDEMHTRHRSDSLSSTYVETAESTTPVNIDEELRRSFQCTGPYQQPQKFSQSTHVADFPTRQASLRERISTGALINPAPDTGNRVLSFTDFTRAQTASPTLIEARKHTPSPASFSRPRPGSASSTSAKSRSIKTASRIPIPDSKKATIVDLNKDRASSGSSKKNLGIPRFGSRRLASPEAMKVLENGKIRRQMQSMRKDESSDDIPLERTSTIGSETSTAPTPSLSHSFDSSPDATVAPSSPESCAVDIPAFGFSAHRLSVQSNAKIIRTDLQDVRNLHPSQRGINETFLGEPNGHLRAPPSSSPFTAPLQTIKSEAVLPSDENGFDDGSNTELVRTLSHLEGKGSPPQKDIDHHMLLQMFGHLKRGQELYKYRDNSAMHQDFAAADALPVTKNSMAFGEDAAANHSTQHKLQLLADNDHEEGHEHFLENKDTAISKWSDSTPSDKPLSPPSEGISHVRQLSCAADVRSSTLQRSTSRDVVSIGYPSCVPADPEDAAAIPNIPSRRSSNTLGTPKSESFQTANNALKIPVPSFARPTTAAQAKTATKLPTFSPRPTNFPEPIERGRKAHSSKTKSEIAPSKTPRPHSRSRLVLDKINGLFSGKRERKSQAVPQVPRIHEKSLHEKSIMQEKSIFHENSIASKDSKISNHRSRPVTPAGATHLLKPPPIPSTPPRPATQNSSPGTTSTDDTTLVDRIFLEPGPSYVQMLSEHLLGKARDEPSPHRKKRLLTFAQVLTNSLISVREAAISAEKAQTAAQDARMHYEMTLKGLTIVQRLATSVARSPAVSKR